MTTKTLWLIVCAVLGAAYLIARWFDRRATKTITGHLDAALLHGGDWTEADEASADCLDCAQDQAIGITRDGSHDRVRLSMCERITLEDLERRLEEAS